MNEINQEFGDRVVSRGLWPPWSPDLNPCDFYLWGKLKDKVYVNNPHTPDELKDNILVEISHYTREKLRRVAGNIFRKCEACLQAEGRHFEILLWDEVGCVCVLCPLNRPAVSRRAVHRYAAKRPLQCRKPTSIVKGHPVGWRGTGKNYRKCYWCKINKYKYTTI
jgi:hypothetical protein